MSQSVAHEVDPGLLKKSPTADQAASRTLMNVCGSRKRLKAFLSSQMVASGNSCRCEASECAAQRYQPASPRPGHDSRYAGPIGSHSSRHSPRRSSCRTSSAISFSAAKPIISRNGAAAALMVAGIAARPKGKSFGGLARSSARSSGCRWQRRAAFNWPPKSREQSASRSGVGDGRRRRTTMVEGRQVVEDSGHTGLTLRDHPMSFLRDDLRRKNMVTGGGTPRIVPHTDLIHLRLKLLSLALPCRPFLIHRVRTGADAPARA